MIPETQFLKEAYLQLVRGQCHGTTFTNIKEEEKSVAQRKKI